MATRLSDEHLAKTLIDGRTVELELRSPPREFDAKTLRAIHKYLFQDFRQNDLPSPSPGEFRETWRHGDYGKTRHLRSVQATSLVAYSPMDEASIKELDTLLKDAQPERLRTLPPKEFVKEISTLYARLDYIHPFEDGNSRTLRTFTKQLARASGYTLDWAKTAETPDHQDLLALARDRAVGEIAKERMRNRDEVPMLENSMRRFRNNPGLEELVGDITRPTRAVAFEGKDKQSALKDHPELAASYAILRSAELKAEAEGFTMRQRATILTKTRENLIAALDRGEVPSIEIKEEKTRAPDLSR